MAVHLTSVKTDSRPPRPPATVKSNGSHIRFPTLPAYIIIFRFSTFPILALTAQQSLSDTPLRAELRSPSLAFELEVLQTLAERGVGSALLHRSMLPPGEVQQKSASVAKTPGDPMDIIVDIDGTLANIEHRLHFIRKPSLRVIEGTDNVKRADYEAWKAWKPNWDAFFDACDKDTPIEPVCEMVRQLIGYVEYGNNVVFVTGRPGRMWQKTVDWLHRHLDISRPSIRLFMRKDGDHRSDDVVKREILSLLRRGGYDPKLAIDDRQQVVDMWRAEGLICAQVAKGDF